MTTSLVSTVPHAAKAPGALASISVAIVAGSAVIGLLLAAVTFGALALAFPLSGPIAQQYHVWVSARDLELAGQLARLWPVFATIALACVAAAIAVVVKATAYVDRAR